VRCDEVGRDYDTIKKSVMVWLHIRDQPHEAVAIHNSIRVAAGMPATSERGALAVVPGAIGTIESVVEAVRAYGAIGVDELLIQMHEPYDFETLTRLPELRAACEAPGQEA
jgi:alkanesulfonate monooxygenase SsuD/methylene tetrahydromethanopterin reductase-like flavin-dependent oxidoreductase (luciferase family)